MANEIRLRRNNIAGTTTDNPLTSGATTINSPGFVDLPVVDTTNHLLLILDPLETSGAAEIVRVTAHAASASSLTVIRGAETTTPRQHALGTTWFHGPVASDFNGVLSYAQVVADQGAITTSTDLTGLTTTVTVGDNRRIKVTGHVAQWNRAAGTVSFVQLRLLEGATLLQYILDSSNNNFAGSHFSAILTPTPGSHTYKLQANCDGTITLIASATNPAYIMVEDLGPVQVAAS